MKALNEYPTPETDAAFGVGEFNTQDRSMKFARSIERRLALAREVLDLAKDALDTAEAALDPTYILERQEIKAALANANQAIAATAPKL